MSDFPTLSEISDYLIELNLRDSALTSEYQSYLDQAITCWLQLTGYRQWISTDIEIRTYDGYPYSVLIALRDSLIEVDSIKIQDSILDSSQYQLLPYNRRQKTHLELGYLVPVGGLLEVSGRWGYALAGESNAVPSEVWGAVRDFAAGLIIAAQAQSDVTAIRQGEVSIQYAEATQRITTWNESLKRLANKYAINLL